MTTIATRARAGSRRIGIGVVALLFAIGCSPGPRPTDGAAPSPPTGLAAYELALQSLPRLDDDQRAAPDDAALLAIRRIGAIYRALSPSDQSAAMQQTPPEMHLMVSLGVLMAEKDEVILTGWGHPHAYYTRMAAAIRAATPPDGQDHCFRVVIDTDRVLLTPIPEIPADRGASTATVVAKIVDDALTAGYVFSDMGHAGVCGILFSDADLPINTTAYTGGPRYWMFSDVGKPLFPHIYQAWNNID